MTEGVHRHRWEPHGDDGEEWCLECDRSKADIWSEAVEKVKAIIKRRMLADAWAVGDREFKA